MVSSSVLRSAVRRARTRISADGTATVRIVTEVTTPVSPMPPTVAQKAAGSRSGPRVRTSPHPSTRSRECTHCPKLPSTWWFLPCTSAATAPPTETWAVPGSTGRLRPWGSSSLRARPREVPADIRTRPVSPSSSSGWSGRNGPTSMPPAFCAASP